MKEATPAAIALALAVLFGVPTTKSNKFEPADLRWFAVTAILGCGLLNSRQEPKPRTEPEPKKPRRRKKT